MPSFSQIGRIVDAPNEVEGFARHCAMAQVAGRKPLKKAEFLRRYGSTWANEQTEAQTIEQIVAAAVKAAMANLSTPVVPVTVEELVEEDAPQGWVKGARFAYTSNSGNRVEHTIERVKAGRVYTDQGKRFRISTLEGAAASQVEAL